MDFGIFLDFPTGGGAHEDAFRDAFELVDLADELGLDTVWLGETHFTPERAVHSAQMVIASAIASRTKQLQGWLSGPRSAPGPSPAHRRGGRHG